MKLTIIKFYSIEAIYSVNIESNNKLEMHQKGLQSSLYKNWIKQWTGNASKGITI